MPKLTLSTISSRYASVAALNANFQAIVTALENTLSRDGSTPNTMSATLDMNSNRIINGADAVTSSDIPTLRQLTALIAQSEMPYAVVLKETHTATPSQTVFTLTGMVYVPGANNLSVYVNGLRLHPTDYTETSATVVTMASGLASGDEVVFYTNEELMLTDPVNIAGGTINATTVGLTTPAAGAFTTLSASGVQVTSGTITAGSTTSLSLATSGGTQALFLNAASAVNYLAISGAGAGADVYLQPQGSDTNIGLFVGSKGTDSVFLHTGGSSYTTQAAITHTASAVNYVSLTGGAIANPVFFTAAGSDTNIGTAFSTKGSASHSFYTNGLASALQAQITHTASANRYLTLTGSNGGNPRLDTSAGSLVLGSGGLTNAFAITGSGASAPILSPVGNANLGMAFYSAGTGAIDFGTAGGTLQVKINHTASAVNYLQLTGGATGQRVELTATGSDADVSMGFYTKAAGNFAFYTNVGASELQALITRTASANRYITLTGSNGGNPTIGTSAGNLALGSAAGALVPAGGANTGTIGTSGTYFNAGYFGNAGIIHRNPAALVTTAAAMNNGAAAAAGTLTNAPVAGNPTKWIPIDDNGTTRYIPAW